MLSGAQPADFLSYVDAFYKAAAQDELQHIASRDINGQAHKSPNVDRRFQEQVWLWLTQHPDVRVEKSTESCRLTLSEAEVLRSSQANVRLLANEDRMWHAVAGHGPDLQRIPRFEFICLSMITSRREKGILQADLTRGTGQDKRSVPRRTQNLCKNGYIEKKPVLFNGGRTSWLYAKQFAPKTASLNNTVSEATEAVHVGPEHSKGAVVDYRAVFNGIFDILRDAKSKLITNNDLIEKLVCCPRRSRFQELIFANPENVAHSVEIAPSTEHS